MKKLFFLCLLLISFIFVNTGCQQESLVEIDDLKEAELRSDLLDVLIKDENVVKFVKDFNELVASIDIPENHRPSFSNDYKDEDLLPYLDINRLQFEQLRTSMLETTQKISEQYPDIKGLSNVEMGILIEKITIEYGFELKEKFLMRCNACWAAAAAQYGAGMMASGVMASVCPVCGVLAFSAALGNFMYEQSQCGCP